MEELPRVSDDQILFAQHLLATVRRMPPNHVLAWTAGHLRKLLERLPGAGAGPIAAGPGNDFGVTGVYVERFRGGREKGHLPRGEPLRRVLAYFGARSNAPAKFKEIAAGANVIENTLQGLIGAGHLERDGLDPHLWRPRTVQPIPLSPRDSQA